MNAKTIVGILVGVLAFFGAKYAVKHFMSSGDELPENIRNNPAYAEAVDAIEKDQDKLSQAESVEEALKITEGSLKNTLPIQVDEYTRLVDVKAGPGKLFTYEYTLSGLGEITAEQLEEAMRPELEKQYNGPGMRAFKRGKVVALYRYNDVDGNLITEIRIGPKE
ncbi:MAG: hypothetical protein HKN23_14200 [Verrucomicrobiales bacterium]|nr:hypothetical protein [Verrucomicrobiales bacterium]